MTMLAPRAATRQKYERLALHAVLFLNFGLVFIYLFAWTAAYRENLFWRADFTSFYTAWRMVGDGQGAWLYDFDQQSRSQGEILAGRSFKDNLLPYINPPGIALLFYPLALYPLATAFLAWTALLLAQLYWLVRLLLRFSHGWEPLPRWLLIGTVLALPPLFTSFLLGAFSLLIMNCTFEMYFAMKNGRQERTALWLFIGAVKPQNFILPGLMLLSSRRWRALLWAALGCAGMALVTSLLFGWHLWPEYMARLRQVSDFFGEFGMYPEQMVNLRGALTTLLGPQHGRWINQISTLALAASAGLVLWVWRKPIRADLPAFELRMALTLALASFFNLHLYPQDAILYVIPALLFYEYIRRVDLPRRAYSAFLLACPVLFLFFEYVVKDSLPVRGSVAIALLLLLWIGKAWLESAQ